MNKIDLSGKWLYETDENDIGLLEGFYKRKLKNAGFVLPGTACGNKIGKKREYYPEFSKEAVRAPREKYEYISPLWLQRTVYIPKELEGKSVKLFMERVNIASELWIDGEKIGRQIIELSTPHIYDLTGKLTEGEHTLTLRIDNRDLIGLNDMASGYSVDTGGYWIGVIGRIELISEPMHHIGNAQIFPDENGIDIKLPLCSTVYDPYSYSAREKATVEIGVTAPCGKTLKVKTFNVELCSSTHVEYLRYDIPDIEPWSEFDTGLYTLHVKLISCGETDEKDFKFGMRTITTDGRKIVINGKQTALRGTIDCAIYPITGHPPMDKEAYKNNFEKIKSYGLNHVRFHAWCPPEAAFVAADEVGLYVSVEMPMWLNYPIGKHEVGSVPMHRSYYTLEAVNISKTYGNHPSFIMFSNGNELSGDFELLADIITQVKALDNRRIYTLTSNCDRPVHPCEDYFCACDANGKRVRIQDMYDKVAASTVNDFDEAINSMNIPVVSFEVGQYCVYPDVDVTEKYTGNMMAVNFDVIKKNMKEKCVYHKLRSYIAASGRLALLLYKEDIESNMRTKDIGGFELLALSDYTGQSTATVGMLDVLYEEKGFTNAEEFKAFCNCVVPLFKAKRIFTNTEVLHAELDLYDFGKEKIHEPVFELSLYDKEKLYYTTKTTQRSIDIPLDNIKHPTMLRVELRVNEYKNWWNIFVFCEENAQGLGVISSRDELEKVIKEGGTAVVGGKSLKKPINGNFIPVFWSPVHFPTDKACGAMIDKSHAVFERFPTDECLDFQWKELMDNSRCADISGFGADFKPIIETVPNFAYNTPASPLFEAKVGKAKLLFCGFDLDKTDMATRALKSSVYEYVNSERFCPKQRIDEETLLSLADLTK